MIKYNSILWLKSLKIALFVAQLLFLTLIITSFVIAVFPPSITANSSLTVGSYESDKILNSVAFGFKTMPSAIANYAFIAIDFFVMLIIVISFRCKFHYDFHKKMKHFYLDTLLNLGIIVLLTVFIFSPLQVEMLDFRQVVVEPRNLNLFWDYSGNIGVLDFRVQWSGIILMTVFCIIAVTSIVNYLFLIKSIVNHKFF